MMEMSFDSRVRMFSMLGSFAAQLEREGHGKKGMEAGKSYHLYKFQCIYVLAKLPFFQPLISAQLWRWGGNPNSAENDHNCQRIGPRARAKRPENTVLLPS